MQWQNLITGKFKQFTEKATLISNFNSAYSYTCFFVAQANSNNNWWDYAPCRTNTFIHSCIHLYKSLSLLDPYIGWTHTGCQRHLTHNCIFNSDRQLYFSCNLSASNILSISHMIFRQLKLLFVCVYNRGLFKGNILSRVLVQPISIYRHIHNNSNCKSSGNFKAQTFWCSA